ncbi:TOMM precursor leader peptide-binding protein [Amycolatopsis nigrescens]|uniref:TOMM precursor leader peptide-binding protein n=1 Tax=Amycolatopsis nigrescens TaxID=381445 RepID=UPI0003795ECD|nr:TOMM precursor leader peptide-binding protein [Amycolatopsis nigrescens]
MLSSGTTSRFLDFKRHLRAEISEGDGAYLFSERGVIAMRGAQIAALAALLDGTRDFAGLLRERPAGMDEEQIAALLVRLVEADLVTLRSPRKLGVDERTLAYWDACGVDAVEASERPARINLVGVGGGMETVQVGRALRDAGLKLVGGLDSAGVGTADLSVVLCEDYLDPRLAEVDAEHRAAGQPWLLARPVGSQVWLGPILRPGESACWHCLTNRLWGQRHAEACVQAALGHVGPAPRPASAVPPLTSAAAHLIALEVSKWLAGYRYPGQDCVWVLDSLDLRGKLHELRRRPQCPSCGDPSLVAARTREPVLLRAAKKASCGGGGHRTLTPGQVLDRYQHLVSPVTGIIREIRPDPRSPAFVNAYLSGPNVVRNITGMAALRASLRGENGGKGATPMDAEVGALCEAVERHSGNYQGDELRISGSLRSFGADAVHPNDCMLYADRQYRTRRAWNAEHASFQHVCEPFDDDAVLDWTPLWSLTSGRQRLLPTGLLYYGAPDEAGHRSVRADSNGNAAGSSVEDAILQGTLELVERDAVALWWYNRTPMPGVDLACFGDPWIEEMSGQYAELGRELWALDLTSDLGVPVMVAISRRTAGPPEQIMFGFGAHLDPRTALRRAVSELNQLLPVVLEDGAALDDPDALRWLRSATVANQPYLMPATGVPARTPADFRFVHRPDIRDDVRALVRTISGHGMETLVLDQTRPDVELPVVKVVVPGLRSFWARFAPGRLFDVPVRLGRLTEPTPYERLNPFPMFL